MDGLRSDSTRYSAECGRDTCPLRGGQCRPPGKNKARKQTLELGLGKGYGQGRAGAGKNRSGAGRLKRGHGE